MLKCPSVSAWLSQFTVEERPLAAITLENLRLATNDEVSHDLAEALIEKMDRIVRSQSKIIIEAIVPLEDVTRYLLVNSKEDGIKGSEHYPLLYEDYYPSEIRDSDSGSEKLLDVVIRSEYQRTRDRFAAAKQPNPLIRSRAEIDSIKGVVQKIDFVLLTDNIGSGKQVIDYLEKLSKCCTDGAFASCDFNISILAWTATNLGIEAIIKWANTTLIDTGCVNEAKQSVGDRLNIFQLNRTETFHELSSSESRDQLFQLFQKYGDPKNDKSSRGLGFGQAATRTVLLGSSCPNNVPDFLHAASENGGYFPLFPGKRIPRDLNDYIISERRHQSSESTTGLDHRERLRQQRLLVAANRPTPQWDATWGILVLVVAGTTRDEAILSSNISYHHFRRAEQRLISLGWITSDFIPTEEGENTVRTYGRKGNQADYASARRFMKRQVDARHITYYPQSLRGVR